MTDDDKATLASLIADDLRDVAYGLEADPDLVARLIVDRTGPFLHQMGWMPPQTYDLIRDWGKRLGEIPEHHINRSVLNSYLSELWQIL